MNSFNHSNFRTLIDRVDNLSNPDYVTESILIEGLLDTLTKSAGQAIKEPFTIVRNSAQGAAVIAKALSNPQYLETLTFLLKKYINNAMKQIKVPQVVSFLSRVMPTGRTATDFLKALFLLPVINLVKITLSTAKDQLTDVLKEYLLSLTTNLDKLVNTFLMQGFGAITTVLSTLKLSNMAFFDVLSMLNKKIVSAPGSNPVVAESKMYSLNISNYTAITA